MRYFVRRVVFYTIALWAAVTLNFFLPRMMPGNPVEILISKFKGRVSPQALFAYEKLFGLDQHKNLLQQYWGYLGNLLHGNLGVSLGLYPETVSSAIMQALPWTLFLMGVTTLISFVLGTLIGIVSAWRRGSLFDSVAPTILTFFSAFPYFWLALILIYFFAFKLDWFPLGHAFGNNATGWKWSDLPDIFYHATLPAFTIILASIGGWLLGMRNNMMTILSEEYVKVAKAKGLPTRRIMLTYAARNAILPNITSFAMSLGFILGGAVLTEVVFSYPGLGYALMQAVGNEDYPMMQGTLLIIAIAVLIANLIADMLYVVLDPRARQSA